MLRGISVKAVLLGTALDWVLSLLFGLVAGFALVTYSMTVLNRGVPPDAAALALMAHSSWSTWISSLAGSIMTLLAGFVTGWLARSNRIKNAFAMSLLSVGTSLIFIPLVHDHRVWYWVLMGFLTIVSGLIGGFLSSIAFDHPRDPVPTA